MPYDRNGQWVTSTSPDDTYATHHVADADQILARIPLIGGLSGSQGRIDAAQNAIAADQNRAYWDSLTAPTADQLTPDYQWDNTGRDAQMAALGQLQEWGRGGLTGADRGMLETTRRRDAQASRGQRGALMQQAQARGVGGSGLDYATQMAANQAGQTQASDAETQMMAQAQQRALSATGASAALGGQIRQGDAHQTELEAEGQTDATQQAYQDQMQRAAGATQQYSTDSSSRDSARQRDAQRYQSDEAGWGAIISALAS